MHIVYPVRPGETNEELRFSLRSLRNYPAADAVWIVGFCPSWVTGVEVIAGNASASPRTNVYQNLLSAMRHPDVAEDVVVFNDDFFVTAPVTEVQTFHRGTLDSHLSLPSIRASSSWWSETLRLTRTVLLEAGVFEPLSFEVHMPMPFQKSLMVETMERFAGVNPVNPPQWRSLYGNLHVDRVVQVEDCKATRSGPIRTPFHSTSDLSWRMYAKQMRELFPEPCQFEGAPRPARISG